MSLCKSLVEETSRDSRFHQEYRSFRFFAENDGWHEEWAKYFVLEVMKAADAYTRKSQILALRGLLLDEVEGLIRSQIYFSDKFTDKDREVLGKLLAACEATHEAAQVYLMTAWFYKEASVICLRVLLHRAFNDAKANDYFDLYCESYQLLMETYFKTFIEKHDKDKSSSAENALFKIGNSITAELRERILSGENFSKNDGEVAK
jgi:hypothetical protein